MKKTQHSGALMFWVIWFSGASRWFRIVRILTSPYQDTVLWNSNLEYYKSSIINSMAFDDTSNTLSPEPSTQSQPPTPISQVSDPNAFYGNYFIPADPLLLGCVEEPKGSPLCAGGYSDVWRCKVRFSTPSEALPVEVSRHITITSQTALL